MTLSAFLSTLRRPVALVVAASAALLSVVFVPSALAADAPTAVPTVTVAPTTVSPDGTTTITVTGTGFDPAAVTATRPPLAGSSGGVYVGLGVFAPAWRPSEGAAASARPTVAVKWAVLADDAAKLGGPSDSVIVLGADGSFQTTFDVTKAEVDALEGAPADGVLGVYTYPGGGAVNASFETATPITFASAPAVVKGPGVLTWKVLSSFVDYVTGPIANGSVTLGDGAAASKAGYRFGQTGTKVGPKGLGITTYAGSVRFTGHDGALDITLSTPVVKIVSAKKATLSVLTGGKRVVIANLKLAKAKHTTTKKAITYKSVPATLSKGGVAVFGGNYPAGTKLDPVTFGIAKKAGAAHPKA